MLTRNGAAVAIALFVLIPFSASATTSVATSTATSSAPTITALQTLITKLETEFAALTAAKGTTPTPASGPTQTRVTFTRVLSLGSKGVDVSALQQILKSAGFYTYPAITTYFGPLTQKALATYQIAHGLDAVGYTGSRTRALLNSSAGVLGSGSTAQPAGTPATGSLPAASATSSPSAVPPLFLYPVFPGYGGGGGGVVASSGGGGGSSPAPDTTPPSVSLTAPAASSTVSGSSVTLIATASDNVAVGNVQFKVDGASIGSAIGSSPFTTTWNSNGVSDGPHTLYAVAEDTSGNYATSSIPISVRNAPPVISSIATSSVATTSATITWTTDEPATSQINYGTSGSYGSASSSAGLVTSHSIILSGLASSTTYHFQVVSVDGQGNTATSGDQTFTTNWILSGASVDMDFANARYYGGTPASLLSVSRASPAVTYAPNSAGLLIAFAPNVLRITNQGILIEGSRTNVVLYDRDLTNAAWTKSNVTATLNQLGADGVAASASEIVATATNGTVLQSTTVSSSTQFETAYVKRITGTGVIEMTMDGGATWTPIQGLINSSTYTRVSIPAQALANPTVGFRIDTSGDAVAVDLVQNETGASPTSPIPTTSTPVARSTDLVSLTGLAASTIEASSTSVLVITPPQIYTPSGGTRLIGSNSPVPLNMGSNTQAQNYNGTSFTTATIPFSGSYSSNTIWSITSWTPSLTTTVANGGTPASNANGMSAITTAYLGSSNGVAPTNGFISRLTLWPSALSSAQLQAVSSPGAIFSSNAVIGWGDSLTSGNQDGTGVTWPTALYSLLGSSRLVYNEGIGGQTSTQILARFLALPQGFGNTTIFEMGRNDFSSTSTVEANIATAVAALTTTNYLVSSILPSATDSTSSLAMISSLNSDLAAQYGSRFVNTLAPLQAANNGSANDLADVAAGIIPRSLRTSGDPLHLNAAGYTIVANSYYAIIHANGW